LAETIKTSIGTMWLDEAGLLWHRLDEGVSVSAQDVEETLAAVRSLTAGKRVPAVVDIRGAGFADRAARDGFAGDEETSWETATALIIDQAFSRRLGNLYLRWSKPDRPVRLFTSEEAAVAWATTFLGE
jgi:hypothetical protein